MSTVVTAKCSVCGKVCPEDQMPDGICSNECREVQRKSILADNERLRRKECVSVYDKERVAGDISINDRMLEILASSERKFKNA